MIPNPDPRGFGGFCAWGTFLVALALVAAGIVRYIHTGAAAERA